MMQQEGEGSCTDNGIDTAVSAEEKAAEQIKLPQSYLSKNNYAVIAICVALSMIFARTGLLSLFFLVPLGYAVMISGSIWITFFAAAFVNIVISLIMRQLAGSSAGFLADVFYFSVILLMFVWIIGGRSLRTTYRFIIASAAGAAAFIVFIMNNRGGNNFNIILAEMAELLSPMFASSSLDGKEILTPERFLGMIKSVSLRGGAVFSMFVVFFLNRQITLTTVLLIKRQRNESTLMQYYAPSQTIWVLSGALATVIISWIFRIEILEILSWNVLTICAILFLAQGTGIVMHLLSKRTSVVRIMISVFFAILLVSPMGVIIIAGLLLLGISETWLPMRIVRSE